MIKIDKLIYNTGFGIIPKALMLNPSVSSDAKSLFCYLASYAGNGDTAFPRVELILYHMNWSKTRFYKYRKELEEKGYLEVTQIKEEGKFAHNIYRLKISPIENTTKSPCPNFEDTGNEDTGNEDTVFEDTGNWDTKINSIKINNNKNNNIKINRHTNIGESVNENLSSMSKLYQENIGLANGIVAEYLIEISEQIDVPLFKRAIEICAEKGNNNLGYLKGIIKKWLEKNITTLEQLKAYELQNKKQSTNSVNQSNKFIPKYKVPGENKVGVRVNETFRNYDPDELEKLLRESQKGKF